MTTHFLIFKIVFILIFFQNYSSYSQFISDRPGIGDSPQIVLPSNLHLEYGFNYYKPNDNSSNISNEMDLASILLRYGINENAEIRFTLGYTKSNLINNYNYDGLSQIGIGTKLKICDNKGLIPQTSFILLLDLPYGYEEYKPEKVEPNLSLVFENPIDDDMSLSYNIGTFWIGSEVEYIFSLGLTRTIFPDFDLSFEIFTGITDRNAPIDWLQFMMIYKISDNLQTDFTVAKSFILENEIFISVGCSIIIF